MIEQALGVVGDRAHQVHGPAVLLARGLDGFIVDRDRRVFFRVVRGQPFGQHGVELTLIESLESATEGRFAGHLPHAGRRVRAAAQMAALGLAELAGKPGETFGPALARDGGDRGDCQDGGQQMAATAGRARVGELIVETLPQRAELGGLVGAPRQGLRHLRGQVVWQLLGPQPRLRLRVQRTHPELFGMIEIDVKSR